MPARCIVSVEPASGKGKTVVLEVQQQGSQPLDVRVVGCDGDDPYVATIKHGSIAGLKHKFKGTDDEWAAVLSHFLLQQPPSSAHASILQGVRLVYTLQNNNLALSFRQHVQGIKVTLGEIVLPLDEEFELDAFDWVRASAMAHAQTLQQLAGLNASVNNEQDAMVKLNAQLHELIKTKNETETQMLQQFMALLNEKKRKIRDQGRLLASAKVDASLATTVHATRTGTTTKPRKAGASRTSKRKVPAPRSEPDLAPDSDSDSDQMEMVQAKTEEQNDEEIPEPATPDRSDDETDDEGEQPPQTRAKSAETTMSVQGSKGDNEESASKGVPPQRALPFGRRATRSKDVEKKPLPPAADDDNDETEDEEL